MRISAMLAFVAAMAVSSVQAAGPTQKDAVAMTEKAVAYAKTHGPAALIEKINAKSPEFINGEMYVVVLKADGTHVAHPVNAKLIGKSMIDVPDPDGKLFRKERVELAASKGKGWVDYKYKNPENGKIEQKTAWVQKYEDLIVSVGVYRD